MTVKYLQLRVHDLKCLKITQNRQNIFGISLENDPDSIDISAIITDAVQGVVAEAPWNFKMLTPFSMSAMPRRRTR